MRNGIYVDGIKQACKNLKLLSQKVNAKVITKSLMAAGGVYKREAAAKVEANNLVITGMLRKNMLVRLARKRSNFTRMAAVGPRYKTKTLRRTQRGTWRGVSKRVAENIKNDTKLIRVNPGKYAHLVEYGHGGPRPAPPHPFLRPTFATKTNAAKRAFYRVFFKSLNHEVKRLKK